MTKVHYIRSNCYKKKKKILKQFNINNEILFKFVETFGNTSLMKVLFKFLEILVIYSFNLFLNANF